MPAVKREDPAHSRTAYNVLSQPLSDFTLESHYEQLNGNIDQSKEEMQLCQLSAELLWLIQMCYLTPISVIVNTCIHRMEILASQRTLDTFIVHSTLFCGTPLLTVD